MAWAALTAAFVGTEAIAIYTKNWGGTFTENVRKLFRTHTKIGWASFALIWSAFSIWFFGHILELWP